MADQRRRGGRGRSGRGGRIPRRGEQQSSARDEAFVSFPNDQQGPIRVTGTIDEGAVLAVLRETLGQELRQAAALRAAAERTGDPILARLPAEVDRHREVLEQLTRELGADQGADPAEASRPAAGNPAEADLAAIAAEQRVARLGWLKLQRAGFASGDRRIDRAVAPVLREKERHAELLDSFVLTAASRVLFREPEY